MSQIKLFYRNAFKPISTMAAIAMVGLVALISAFFIASDSASNSYATDTNNEVTAEIDSTHYVTLSAPDVTLSLTHSDSSKPSIQSINVDIETNAAGGADLYLAMSGNTNALHLNGDTTSTAPAIEATSSPVAASDLAANTWGYSIDDQTYSAVPTANSDPALLASVDGESVGSSADGVITASVPVYFAASVDISIPAGSYANRMTYSAVTDGGIITEASLTKIEIDGAEVENMQPEVENTLLITTNLMTNAYGTPRVYYETTSPAGYQECSDVTVGRNESGYMTITCKVTPTQAATGVTLHVVPKGSSDDTFCTDGTYKPDTSECEAGEWKWGSFVVSAPDIAKPKPPFSSLPVPSSFEDIEYMQHMTPDICDSANEGDTKQLTDYRDDKSYWVAKLADGNCWMTQNLELNLTAGKILTPEDSDLSRNWDPGATTFTSAQEGIDDRVTVQSWNLGKVVWKNPDSDDYCSPKTNFSESACTNYWQDVSSGWSPMTLYRADGITYDADAKTYDAHYLAGNYYSWEAATAGTGSKVSTVGQMASDSICPAGWKLPISGDTNGSYDNASGSFYNLLMNAYNITNSSTGSTTMRNAPLFLVLSGYVYPRNSKKLTQAGDYGTYRSSVSYTTGVNIRAFGMRFTTISVFPSNSTVGSVYEGHSVRCVADWE